MHSYFLKMIKGIKLLFLAGLLFAATVISAQNERPVFTLHLWNGDVLSGVADLSTLSFKTPYGDLAFPVREVAGINLGLSTFGIDKAQLMALIDQIQTGEAPNANAAFERVIKMEAGALPYIRDYLESPAYHKHEGADISVDLAYEVLLSRHKMNRNFKTKDMLQTIGGSAIEGNYDFESLTIETEYGRLMINRSKISSISVMLKEIDNAGSGTFKLMANQHIAGNANGGWLSTGILVHKDQVFKISASGQVNIASLSNNAYAPDGGVNGSPGQKGSEPTYGSLVFKIGESGTLMKAGDAYMGHANATGIIYLSIMESVYNAANTGSYTVKVAVN